jgi:hypothetical protein
VEAEGGWVECTLHLTTLCLLAKGGMVVDRDRADRLIRKFPPERDTILRDRIMGRRWVLEDGRRIHLVVLGEAISFSQEFVMSDEVTNGRACRLSVSDGVWALCATFVKGVISRASFRLSGLGWYTKAN